MNTCPRCREWVSDHHLCPLREPRRTSQRGLSDEWLSPEEMAAAIRAGDDPLAVLRIAIATARQGAFDEARAAAMREIASETYALQRRMSKALRAAEANEVGALKAPPETAPGPRETEKEQK